MKVEYSDDMRVAYFDGYKFRRDAKTGYYLSSRNTDIGRCERLHRYIWRYFNGDIPNGYHIHHKDEDKSHNDIENLECLPRYNHLSLHGHERFEKDRDAMIKNLNVNARPKASEWHASEAGKEWHKQHYEKTKAQLHMTVEKECEYCGKLYKTIEHGRNRFCSNNCSSAARRASGIDNEQRKCVVCGKDFTINKYAKGQTCSRKCANIIRWNTRRKADGR